MEKDDDAGHTAMDGTCTESPQIPNLYSVPSKYRINVKIIEMVIIIYWHVSTKPAIHINHPPTHLTIPQPPPGGRVFAFKRFVYHN